MTDHFTQREVYRNDWNDYMNHNRIYFKEINSVDIIFKTLNTSQEEVSSTLIDTSFVQSFPVPFVHNDFNFKIIDHSPQEEHIEPGSLTPFSIHILQKAFNLSQGPETLSSFIENSISTLSFSIKNRYLHGPKRVFIFELF